MSLTCQNCPDVVQALNAMSVINPRITHTAIDGALFQDEVEAKQILAVPTVFLNGELVRVRPHEPRADRRQARHRRRGAAGGGHRREGALRRPRRRAADRPAQPRPIYAARKGIRTGVAAERFGGQVLDTMAIENFISVPYTEGPRLATALEQHVLEYGVDVMNLQRAKRLVPAGERRPPHGRARQRRGAARRGRSSSRPVRAGAT